MRNRVDIIGRLGKDPEVRNLDSGRTVASFSMATTEKWKDKDGNAKEHTEWHNIVVWGKTAEIVQKYVHKGDLLSITGKLRTRKWEKDGIDRYTTEILVDEVILLPNARQNSSSSSSGSSRNTTTSQTESGSAGAKVADDNDDLPF